MAVETTHMRKFLNDPSAIVKESLAGLAAAYPDLLRYDVANQIIVRKDARRAGKVALISGGGSGHEPLHGGFVGLGMLDAAAPGEVFTSPVPGQMLAATKAVDGGAGVVHIVKNYTGDVLNFKLAAEDAADEGIKVTAVVIDDDVAVQDSLYTAGGRGGRKRGGPGQGHRHGQARERACTLFRSRAFVMRTACVGQGDL